MEKKTKKTKSTKINKITKPAKSTKTKKVKKATKATKATKAMKATKTTKKELTAKDRKKVSGGTKSVPGALYLTTLNKMDLLSQKDLKKPGMQQWGPGPAHLLIKAFEAEGYTEQEIAEILSRMRELSRQASN